MTKPSGGVEVMTYTLPEEGDGARLTIMNAGYTRLPADARWDSIEQNSAGFGMMREHVRAAVEARRCPAAAGARARDTVLSGEGGQYRRRRST